VIEMCNGSGCNWEIKGGESWGDCGKPPHGVCPESFEDESEAEAAAEEYEDLRGE